MKHFTLRELSYSPTAARKGIYNTPSAAAMRHLTKLVDKLLDPARELWGAPLIVTSGYRSPMLNEDIGGRYNSQHLTGQAADIQTLGNNRLKNYQLYCLIRDSDLPYDQLIAEGCKHGGCDWLHLSYAEGENRRQAFTMN